MAIPATITSTMSQQQNQEEEDESKKEEDHHEQDMVMPGFRFHPTEEELIEFYLRRKVEGKRFNVELITFLDLYRYDPWELPALAAIGEKEWFFYVPRDKKYRNGDRPNRVTTSGYWKATGADRMIRTESFRSIGLKKTLVFYSGKAPKGIRTSWIMNEYRLPHHETERLQKAEISLCRVYKRAGVEDHPSLPRSLPTRVSSSRAALKRNINDEPSQETMEEFQAYNINATNHPHNKQVMSDQTSGSSSDNVATSLALISNHNNNNTNNYNINPNLSSIPILPPPPSSNHHPSLENIDDTTKILQQLAPNCTQKTMFNPSPSFVSSISSHVIDDLHRLVNFQNPPSVNHHHHQQQQHYQVNPDLHHSTLLPDQMQQEPPPPQPQQQQHPLSLNMMLPGSLQSAFSDRLWDWSSVVTDPSKEFHNPFK